MFAFYSLFLMRITIRATSGWPDLFPKYKIQKQINEISDARNLKIRYCNFGGVNQRNLMKFYETAEGLLISPIWLVKQENYNLFIPWSDIVKTSMRKQLFWKSYRLIIGEPFVSFIDLRQKDFNKIKKNLLV